MKVHRALNLNPKVQKQEMEYLLKEVNNYFEKHLTKEDILSSWSGIRPLVKSDKSSTEQMVREHIILKSKNNLVSIAGGKWTTYRKMAEDLVDFLIKNRFLEKQKKCETKKYKLFGNDGDIKELENLKICLIDYYKDIGVIFKEVEGQSYVDVKFSKYGHQA